MVNKNEIVVDVIYRESIEDDLLGRKLSDKEFESLGISWAKVVEDPDNPCTRLVEQWIVDNYHGKKICPTCGMGFEEDSKDGPLHLCDRYLFDYHCNESCSFCSSDCLDEAKINCEDYPRTFKSEVEARLRGIVNDIKTRDHNELLVNVVQKINEAVNELQDNEEEYKVLNGVKR